MNRRWITLFLWTVGGIALAAAGLIAWAGLTLRIEEVAVRPAGQPVTRPSTQRSSGESELSLTSLQAAATVRLRRPLVDPPPAPVLIAETAPLLPPTVSATVVGTILEGAHSMALLASATGGTDLKGIGDFVGDARIVQIAADVVTFEVKGQTVVVAVARPEKLPDKEPDLK